MYARGIYVEWDRNKAVCHYQQAAIGGAAVARYNLGLVEAEKGDYARAIKHWTIAAASGYESSLACMRAAFADGNATKAQYESALRVFQEYKVEVKSNQREKGSPYMSRGHGVIAPYGAWNGGRV